MSNVIPLSKRLKVEVERFGHRFEVEYQVSAPIIPAIKQARLLKDGEHVVDLTMSFKKWEEGVPDLSVSVLPDRVVLFDENEFGMPRDKNSYVCLHQMQEYVLFELTEKLGHALMNTLPGSGEPVTVDDDIPWELEQGLHERLERGWSAYRASHEDDEGSTFKTIVSDLLFEAVEDYGNAVADWLEAAEEGELDDDVPEEVGEQARLFMASVLAAWAGEDA